MKRKIELLAPGGDLDSIKAAIVAGADAIYCGLNKFNARNRATNIELEDLRGIISLAHRHDCQIFLTINILIVESEFKALVALLNSLVNSNIDGVIVQDFGLFYLLSKYFKTLKIHASTQVTTHNEGQIKFLRKLSVTRVNLSRELNLNEIKALALVGHDNHIESEVFVHGSNCISFSGLCYISSVHEGKSGNRGRCSQPCREQYLTTPEGMNFPLNLKDNSAFNDLEALYAAGVDSVKIEGRVKKFHYVYTVVSAWRRLLDDFYNSKDSSTDDADLYRVFNRDFTNSFLQGDINKDMYIDNPRDNSAQHYAEIAGCLTDEGLDQVKKELHDTKTRIIMAVKDKIKELSIAKSPIRISFTGASGGPLKVLVTTVDSCFEVSSDTTLVPARDGSSRSGTSTRQLDHESLKQRLGSLHETEYFIEELDLNALQEGLFLPFNELTSIKKRIIFVLNGAKEKIEPIEIPQLRERSLRDQGVHESTVSLSVLISSRQQLELCSKTGAELFFQLPNCFKADYSEFVELFIENPQITPWFPAVLIGKDYTAAVDILKRARPKRIVTNNTGIAYAACELEIAWIAGPYLNTVNSFSLLCLKEEFNCSGAFISNELSQRQIKNIVAPQDFKLYYSIYHPIVLMTSRQCLVHQVEGCDKRRIDEDCLRECTRSSSIMNLKDVPLFIDKSVGCYHRIFNDHNFLNTEIVCDFPGMFSSFCIDLTDIETQTEVEVDRARIIEGFESFLNGNFDSKQELEKMIHPTTNGQYKKGI